MTEGIVWVVAVILLVVSCIVLLRHSSKPSLLIIEPLGIIIRSWVIARVIGKSREIKELLGLFQASSLQYTNVLDEIIGSLSPRPKSREIGVIDQKFLSPLAAIRTIEVGRKQQSIVVGLLSEVEDYLSFENSETLIGLKQEAMVGEKNGFLTLVVGVRTAAESTTVSSKRKFKFIGAAMIEAEVDKKVIHQLAERTTKRPVKLLTALPVRLACWLGESIFPGANPEIVDTRSLSRLSPHEQERKVWRSAVLANANLQTRYHMVRLLQHHWHCQVFSRSEEDAGLPVRPVSSLEFARSLR